MFKCPSHDCSRAVPDSDFYQLNWSRLFDTKIRLPINVSLHDSQSSTEQSASEQPTDWSRPDSHCPVSCCPPFLSPFSASIRVGFVVCGYFETWFVKFTAEKLTKCKVTKDFKGTAQDFYHICSSDCFSSA